MGSEVLGVDPTEASGVQEGAIVTPGQAQFTPQALEVGMHRAPGDESVRIHRLIWDQLVADLEEAAATTEQLQVKLEERT
jgi:hypothetical protein